ncbi:hypothetical protein BLA29_014571 [Euroglyphus maynei]|uniref:Uncharacterized protein n=1 Tax=Euroglyphus maynei TaxID=6958 RepID=A0A1Y3B0T6_EURMA|nr:hypothetical protein BLA29_014571 [Euroglyphus maynei]
MVLINGRALPAKSAINLPNILVTNKQTGQEIPLRIGIRKIMTEGENETEKDEEKEESSSHGGSSGSASKTGSNGILIIDM